MPCTQRLRIRGSITTNVVCVSCIVIATSTMNVKLLFVIQSVCTGAGWIEYTLGTDYKIVAGYRAVCLHTGDIKFPTASYYCCVHHWNLLAQS